MSRDDRPEKAQPSLSDEEKGYVTDLFYERIVPKLMRLHARNGMVGCEFAGPRYKPWQIHFRSRGNDFDIVDFEYDEQGCSLDLDL
ncbi:MAG: hypothetical protein R6X07_08475 [Desulfatiglandales bacterium]|jgi:hypothetical protein